LHRLDGTSPASRAPRRPRGVRPNDFVPPVLACPWWPAVW
jgi:hypothetical protein